MEIEIKNRYTNKVILSGNYESVKDCLGDNRGTDLQGAYLRKADLWKADLWRANLQGADLRGAYLQEADLRGAYLQEADLQEADLWRANLQGADLRGADLRRTDYNGEKLGKEPLQLAGLSYFVMITKEQIKIGCELHKVKEWENYTDKEILKMDGKEGLAWWKKHKQVILELNKLHRGE